MALAALLATALAATVAQGAPLHPDVAAGPAATSGPGLGTAPGITSGLAYVSMGSSYASGLGIVPRDPAGGACWRSLHNYAHRLAARLHLRLADVACSGATTDTILTRPQAGFPPQIEAVGPGTRLVTITVGGNNVDYMGNLLGYSCRNTQGIRCGVAPDREVAARLAELPGDLGGVVQAVRRRAPQALVVMVGYLPVLPAAGPASCPAAPLDAGDLHRMRDLYGRLNATIAAVAARTGAVLVPGAVLGEGHDACSAAPYVAGYRPARLPDGSTLAAYHPNAAGMDRLAAAIEAAIGHRLEAPVALSMTEAPAPAGGPETHAGSAPAGRPATRPAAVPGV